MKYLFICLITMLVINCAPSISTPKSYNKPDSTQTKYDWETYYKNNPVPSRVVTVTDANEETIIQLNNGMRESGKGFSVDEVIKIIPSSDYLSIYNNHKKRHSVGGR